MAILRAELHFAIQILALFGISLYINIKSMPLYQIGIGSLSLRAIQLCKCTIHSHNRLKPIYQRQFQIYICRIFAIWKNIIEADVYPKRLYNNEVIDIAQCYKFLTTWMILTGTIARFLFIAQLSFEH